jgi:hypothetical protein
MLDSGLMPGIKLTGEMKEPDAITFIFFNNSRFRNIVKKKHQVGKVKVKSESSWSGHPRKSKKKK